MAKLKQVLTLAIGLLLITLLDNPWGSVPSMGKLLNPYTGFWQNAERRGQFSNKEIQIDGVESEIKIIFDEELIPHIYAENKADLYFAQGYVTAMLRLWQMEFQTHFAAGRLCEIVGPKALQLDEFQRRIGMPWAARNTLKVVMKHEPTRVALQSYSDGVNAYISQLSPSDYPLEYKILDYAPEKWDPLKTSLLLKYMSWDLTGDKEDFAMTELLFRLGKSKLEEIFPYASKDMEPIHPVGTSYDFEVSEIPDQPKNAYNPVTPFGYEGKIQKPHPDNGSNNWVVSGTKTKSGSPILCNDPHLSQRLPSLWMLLHLNAPGVDVFGVNFPGAPGVILGFNKNIAWGATNVDPDILDWYRIRFKDESLGEYFHNGEWVEAETIEETIKIRGGEDKILNIPMTHHGPVSYLGKEDETEPTLKRVKGIAPTGFAMRWAAHEGSNELRTFLQLNEAKNYEEYVEALSHYSCPGQNFAFACSDGDIGLWSNAEYPLKWRDQGKFLLDGEDPSHDWGSRIPHQQNPHCYNPERGFVSSANQHLTDSTYPYYINWEFDPYMRGRRINQRLEEMKDITPQDMMGLQLDNKNLLSERVLDGMLALVDKSKLSETGSKAFDLLNNWNRFNDAEEIGPSIFVFWWEYLQREMWDDELATVKGTLYPDVLITADIILDTLDSDWIDNKETEKVESKSEVLTTSFSKAVKELANKNGSDPSDWKWSKINGPMVPHVANIPGMDVSDLMIGGGKHIVNQQQKSHGPSWRLVAEMKEEPNAFGAIPGGQSGNPGSRYYYNLMDRWAEGDLLPLNILSFEEQKAEDNLMVLKIKGK